MLVNDRDRLARLIVSKGRVCHASFRAGTCYRRFRSTRMEVCLSTCSNIAFISLWLRSIRASLSFAMRIAVKISGGISAITASSLFALLLDFIPRHAAKAPTTNAPRPVPIIAISLVPNIFNVSPRAICCDNVEQAKKAVCCYGC